MGTRLFPLLAALAALSLVLMVGAAAPIRARPTRTALAPSCPPDVVFGCLLFGAGSSGWWVENTSAASNTAGLVGKISDRAPGSGSAGVRGINNGTGTRGHGVHGLHAGGGSGVYGTSVAGQGVSGVSTSGTGASGESQSGTGVFGRHTDITGIQPGVAGLTNSATDGAVGVLGVVTSTTAGLGSAGVRGINHSTARYQFTPTTPAAGVYGSAVASNPGVLGRGEGGPGVEGYSTNGYGIYGRSVSPTGSGVFAQNTVGGYGLRATSPNIAIQAENTRFDGNYAHLATKESAVFGEAVRYNGQAVWGVANNGPDAAAIHGASSSGWAGRFEGKVRIDGSMMVTGQLRQAAGAVTIDHPLDPENRYLSHAVVVAPDMLTVYSGNATLGAGGEVWVELPAYFEALNQDFRYQLTAIGRAAPNLHVAETIANNRFKIAGGPPNLQVSWQVTGNRVDPYAKTHPLVVEEPKPEDERGSYLHPGTYGGHGTAEGSDR